MHRDMSDGNTNCISNTYRVTNANRIADGDTDTYANTDAVSYSDPIAHSYTYRNTNILLLYGDDDANTNTHAN